MAKPAAIAALALAARTQSDPIADAALRAAIQKLLDQVAQRSLPQAQIESMVQTAIQKVPNLKSRLAKIYADQGKAGLEGLFHHAQVYLPTRKLEQWVTA